MEYREITPYYDSRFWEYCNISTREVMENYIPRNTFEVIFRTILQFCTLVNTDISVDEFAE